MTESMLERLGEWWRARSGREQALLQFAALFTFALILPAWAYLAASDFRREAANDLAAAQLLSAQVAELAPADANAAPRGDGTLRGKVNAAAEAAGLQPSSLESSSNERLSVRFEGVDSLAVYRWMAQVGASGVYLTRTTIVRLADSELITAEFDVAESP